MEINLKEIQKVLKETFQDVISFNVLKLSGGSSRDTYKIELKLSSGRKRYLIMRIDPPNIPARGVQFEAKLLNVLKTYNVPVAKVINSGKTPITQVPYVFFSFISGESQPKKILYEARFEQLRKNLTKQCAHALAKIHSVDTNKVPGLSKQNELQTVKSLYEALGYQSPVFDLTIKYLEDNAVDPHPYSFVHGDFRLGNFIVDNKKLKAVLDWELCHVGDPRSDLGWLCAKPWRFGSDKPVGGFGYYDELLETYNQLTKHKISFEQLKYFEILSDLKWGVFCIYQSNLHISGKRPSLDLAAIGRRISETEWDLLKETFKITTPIISLPDSPGFSFQDRPYGWEFIDLIKDFNIKYRNLLTGYDRYQAKIIDNLLDILKRELCFNEFITKLISAELKQLNAKSIKDISDKIKSGKLDYNNKVLLTSLSKIIFLKLIINNPTYINY
jgi:aminoglycoside phosphotransferase (APT) family kinase protein